MDTDTHQTLLGEIHVFVSETGMPESTFGRRSVNDPSLIARLRGGNTITVRKLDRIRRFMASERAARAPVE